MPNINDTTDPTPQSRWEATVDEAVKFLNAPDSRAKAGDHSLSQAVNEFSEFFQGQWSRTAQQLGSEQLAGSDAARMGHDALEDIVASTFGIVTGQGGSLAKGDVLLAGEAKDGYPSFAELMRAQASSLAATEVPPDVPALVLENRQVSQRELEAAIADAKAGGLGRVGELLRTLANAQTAKLTS